jgi:hypothetical protein
VVLGAVGFYYFVVADMRTKNADLLKAKVDLAARFLPLDGAKRTFKKPYDDKLRGLYPLTLARHLRDIPNDNLKKARIEEDKGLSAARLAFIRKLTDPKTGRNFRFDAQRDFRPPPPLAIKDPTMGSFREWVQDEEKGIDTAFAMLGKGIEIELRKSDLLAPNNQGVRWELDGRVNGYIEKPKDRPKVLYRLLLRRQILMAIARTKARVSRVKIKPDGLGEEPVLEARRVGKIIAFEFWDQNLRVSGMPYKRHRVRLTISCHLAVVPALLGELEAIGCHRDPRTGRLEQKRPFAFWAEEVSIKRPDSWPTVLLGNRDMNSERLTEYGRYLEWPVTVFISGVVPEFEAALDPAPKAGTKAKSGKGRKKRRR